MRAPVSVKGGEGREEDNPFPFAPMAIAFILNAGLGVVVRECPGGRLEHTFNIASYSPSCCERDSSWVLKSSVEGAPFTLEGSYLTLAPATQPEKEMPTSAYLLENAMTAMTRPYYLSAEAEALVSAIDTILTAEAGSGEGTGPVVLPALGTEAWCEALATAKQAASGTLVPFQSTPSSNGAPAGCLSHNDGRVVYVATCTGHANCGTLTCNGCEVLAISDAMYAYVNVWYSTYPDSYPEGELGSTNFSIGANRNRAVYDTYGHPDGAVVARIYSDRCPMPPSPPPPPPVEALCVDGDWPLFADEHAANSVSPANASRVRVHLDTTYYMPDSFPGTTHAGPGVACPAHASHHPPLVPPPPHSPPSHPPPPEPSAPPSTPPPHRMDPVVSALVTFLIPAAVLVLLGVGVLVWMLHWREPELRGPPPPSTKVASGTTPSATTPAIGSQVRFSQLAL